MIRSAALCGRLSREVYVHLPEHERLTLDGLISDDDVERWSGPGEPTIYLAGDVGVALAELGRHTRRLPAEGGGRSRRRVVRFTVGLDGVLDLTRRETLAALGIEDERPTFMDGERARTLAREVRSSGDCEAMLVPSIAFLDQPRRWNLVVFVERVADLATTIEAPEDVGLVELWLAGRT